LGTGGEPGGAKLRSLPRRGKGIKKELCSIFLPLEARSNFETYSFNQKKVRIKNVYLYKIYKKIFYVNNPRFTKKNQNFFAFF